MEIHNIGPGHFAAAAGIIAAIAYAAGWTYVAAIKLKRWICDEDLGSCQTFPLAKWLHGVFFRTDPTVEYGVELLITCLLGGLALAILLPCLAFHIGRLIAVPLIGAAIFIFAGSHAARWMVRTGRSLKRLKETSHEHKEV